MSGINVLTRQGSALVARLKFLKLDLPLVLEPTGKTGDQPAYEITSGGVKIGAAWEKTDRNGVVFYSMTMDDPSFDAPLNVSAFQQPGGHYEIVWRRPRQQEAA